MKYIIASCVQEDEVWIPGSKLMKKALGGAGTYAYSGIRIFEENVALLCNVEKGHFRKHSDWYERNHIETKGMSECLEDDGATRIVYFSDGSREDMPQAGLEEKRFRNPTIAQIEQACIEGENEKNEVKGLYMFRHFDEMYLREVIRLSQKYGFLTLWELAADSAARENLPKIAQLCRDISIFSLNLQEAGMLTGCSEKEEIMGCLQRENIP